MLKYWLVFKSRLKQELLWKYLDIITIIIITVLFFFLCLVDMDIAITLDRTDALFKCFSTSANSQHLSIGSF